MENKETELLNPHIWFERKYPRQTAKHKYDLSGFADWVDQDIIEYSDYRLKVEAPTDESLRKIFDTMNQDGMTFSEFKKAIGLLTGE